MVTVVTQFDSYLVRARSGGGTAYGSITSSELLPDQPHTVRIEDNGYNTHYYGVLVITYRVP